MSFYAELGLGDWIAAVVRSVQFYHHFTIFLLGSNLYHGDFVRVGGDGDQELIRKLTSALSELSLLIHPRFEFVIAVISLPLNSKGSCVDLFVFLFVLFFAIGLVELIEGHRVPFELFEGQGDIATDLAN